MARIEPFWRNYINGTWVTGAAGCIDVHDPATGQILAQQALADAGDVDRAVQAAKGVHLSGQLRDMRPIERGRKVQAMGRYLTQHRAEIAEILTLEQGKPLWESLIEVDGAALYFEYYGNQAATVEGRSVPLGAGYYDWTELEPYGVSAQIIPWNYPIEMTARSLSAALATGNACVIKSPELTPLTHTFLAKAAEAAGWPAGAVNILCGLGREAGAALSAHPDVNQGVCTGSVPTGIAIASAAAQNVVPCVLELGGKSAAIVHDDADLAAFETDMRWGIFFNAGQVCSAMSRGIVHESRKEELIERAERVARSLTVQPGIQSPDFGATMGSMVSDAQRDRALGMVADAKAEGARCITGGRKLANMGAFLEPTVLADVTPDMAIAQQEVFGPVLSIIHFDTEEDAVAIANDTPYGLTNYVQSQDGAKRNRMARALRSGMVEMNGTSRGQGSPFGGVKMSGRAREGGVWGIEEFLEAKAISGWAAE